MLIHDKTKLLFVKLFYQNNLFVPLSFAINIYPTMETYEKRD